MAEGSNLAKTGVDCDDRDSGEATALTPRVNELRLGHVIAHSPSHPNKAALSDFILQAHPGENAALVDLSGADMATVLQLLLRFFAMDVGSHYRLLDAGVQPT